MKTTKERIVENKGLVELFGCLKLDGDEAADILADLERTERYEKALRAILDTPDHPMRKKCKAIAQAALEENPDA